MKDQILDGVSIVKLVTGEMLIGLCLQVTEEFIDSDSRKPKSLYLLG